MPTNVAPRMPRFTPALVTSVPAAAFSTKGGSNYGKGDQAACETGNESRSIDLWHVPHSGHSLLDGLCDALRP